MSENYDANDGWMSEASARTKWCPWSRITMRTAAAGINRNFDSDMLPRGTLCIGRQCMAWSVNSFDRLGSGRCGNRGS